MKVFLCTSHKAVIVAFNRGHACKLLGKALEKNGGTLQKDDKVVELEVQDKKSEGVTFL